MFKLKFEKARKIKGSFWLDEFQQEELRRTKYRNKFGSSSQWEFAGLEYIFRSNSTKQKFRQKSFHFVLKIIFSWCWNKRFRYNMFNICSELWEIIWQRSHKITFWKWKSRDMRKLVVYRNNNALYGSKEADFRPLTLFIGERIEAFFWVFYIRRTFDVQLIYYSMPLQFFFWRERWLFKLNRKFSDETKTSF